MQLERLIQNVMGDSKIFTQGLGVTSMMSSLQSL